MNDISRNIINWHLDCTLAFRAGRPYDWKTYWSGKKVKSLTSEQIQKLKSLGIRENTSRNDLAWEEQYRAAKAFYDAHGHLTVPKSYIGENGKNISKWLQIQRDYRKQGKLSEEKTRLLEAIGMTWSTVAGTRANQDMQIVL